MLIFRSSTLLKLIAYSTFKARIAVVPYLLDRAISHCSADIVCKIILALWTRFRTIIYCILRTRCLFWALLKLIACGTFKARIAAISDLFRQAISHCSADIVFKIILALWAKGRAINCLLRTGCLFWALLKLIACGTLKARIAVVPYLLHRAISHCSAD
jgi:hypothetical protein